MTKKPKTENNKEWLAWFESRPPEVQALIREFPPMTVVQGAPGHKRLYVLGYTEGDDLICTPVDPAKDYDRAMAEKVYICASHLRP